MQAHTNFEIAVISQTGACETQGRHQERCTLSQLPDLHNGHALGDEGIPARARYGGGDDGSYRRQQGQLCCLSEVEAESVCKVAGQPSHHGIVKPVPSDVD